MGASLPAAQLGAQAAGISLSQDAQVGQIERAFSTNRGQSLFDFDVGASWEIDLFGGLRRASEAARASYQASVAAQVGARLTVAAQTADAYVLVRTFQARLKLAEQQEDTQCQIEALTDQLFERGLVSAAQRDEVQDVSAEAEAGTPVLKAALEAQFDRLEVLVGLKPGSLRHRLSKPANIPWAPFPNASGGPAALVRRRPDVIAAERILAASNARIGAAVSNYYPKMSLSSLVGFEAADATDLLRGSAFQPLGLVGLKWRLFDFGRIDAEVAAARGARAEALAAYRLSVLKATSDVEVALTNLVQSRAQVRALWQAKSSLAKALEAASSAHTSGESSLLELLAAQARWLKANDEYSAAQGEATQGAISAFLALGGG